MTYPCLLSISFLLVCLSGSSLDAKKIYQAFPTSEHLCLAFSPRHCVSSAHFLRGNSQIVQLHPFYFGFSCNFLFHRDQFFPPYHLPQSVITHLIVCLFTASPTGLLPERIWNSVLITEHRAPSSGAATDRMLHKYLLNKFTLFNFSNVL